VLSILKIEDIENIFGEFKFGLILFTLAVVIFSELGPLRGT
jgi:hypothetical protein